MEASSRKKVKIKFKKKENYEYKRDKELVLRMYFTWFLLGILYFIFVLLLNAFGVQFEFIAVIVLFFGAIQYFMSDKMVLYSSGAKLINRSDDEELFQIVDELLDFTGESKSLGKKTLQDLKDGKVTLPLIIAVSSSSKSNYMRAETILKTRKFDRKSLNFLYNLIVQEGALDKAKKEAEKYSKKALNNVKHLKNSEYKIALQYLLIGNLTRIN